MSIFFYLGLLIPLIAPLIVLYNLVYVPLTMHIFPTTFLMGLLMMALMMSFAQLILKKSTLWLHGLLFCLYYELVLLWQMPWAWITFWVSDWGTRGTGKKEKTGQTRKLGSHRDERIRRRGYGPTYAGFPGEDQQEKPVEGDQDDSADCPGALRAVFAVRALLRHSEQQAAREAEPAYISSSECELVQSPVSGGIEPRNTDGTSFIAISYNGLTTSDRMDSSIVTQQAYEEQMAALHASGYVTITQQDVVDYYLYHSTLPEKAMLLIFEDGIYNTAELAQGALENTVILPRPAPMPKP